MYRTDFGHYPGLGGGGINILDVCNMHMVGNYDLN
jgi:hypothetical protein